ncbi:MAG: tyrosine-type recombinase/integrase [Chloroflexi bacterium]|nr:tyrosine-type recombinase/integrase [Chloroflexota bacterium]
MKLQSSSPFFPIFADYKTWLSRQPLSVHTKRAYRTQVRQFCVYLDQTDSEYGDPLNDEHARDYAVRDYKTYLKIVRKRKPATVNIALAAIDNLYRFLQLPPADVKREDLPQQAPRALTENEQKRFLLAAERCSSARDQAIASLLFYTGLRIGECAALNQDDFLISARKGYVIVRQGKRDSYRKVPLNADVRKVLDAWIINRGQKFSAEGNEAFFLNRQGTRLSTRAIDMVLRKLSKEAGVVLSAHVLRHTCITNLVRNGTDLVIVAEIAGHRRLETTQRYSLPTEQDRIKAMGSIQVDY